MVLSAGSPEIMGGGDGWLHMTLYTCEVVDLEHDKLLTMVLFI